MTGSGSGDRDDFSAGVKAMLANRVGFRCSKPDCRALTAGPSAERSDARTNVGVAAHITAASPGGPRYDATLTSEERRSLDNGIWLCQTHGKQVDDDVSFTVDILRAWKRSAELDARDLLGRPVSAQALDVSIQVALHRADDDTLAVTGATNLPDSTKLWVTLQESGTCRDLGQAKAVTNEGMLVATGFSNQRAPHPHGWYVVEVLAYFNGPWQQTDAVTDIVGREGEHLVGQFAEAVNPEFSDSEKRLRAAFDCIAPPLKADVVRTDAEVQRAIAIAKGAVLTVDGRESESPVGEVVEFFMESAELREFEGWSARELPSGAVVVTFSFWNGSEPASAEWTVILDTEDVRYRNLHGKYMSWAPAE